jgi:Fe-S cluster assembly protein SufD
MSDISEKGAWKERLINAGTHELAVENRLWLKSYREQALKGLADAEFPHRKQERWRYTPTGGLMKNDFSPAHRVAEKPAAESIQQWFTPGLDAYRLVFINGYCCPGYCEIDGLPKGSRIGSLRAAMSTDEDVISEHLGTVQQKTGEMFELLNQAMMNDGLFIHLEKGVTLEKPLEVIYLSDSSGASVMAQPRGLVALEEGASATVIERFVGTEESLYFNNAHTEILLRERAALQHYRTQEESQQAFHLSGIHVTQHESSQYESGVFSLGSSLARTEINTRFAGEHASTKLNGLYLVGDGQTNDVHLDVTHNLPNCESEETYKGLLYGKGKAVFDGKILVAKDAQKTEAHLSNNNLMLTRGAEVDTKPQLEIYADDVKCSHGTTVGQIEEDQVFYMRSRGIEEKTARAMLSMGFAGAIVDRVELEALREDLMSKIQARVNNSLSQASSGAKDE